MRRKRTDFSHVPCMGMSREATALALGGEHIRQKLEDAGELAPFYRSANSTLYATVDVAKAFARFRAGQTKIPLTPQDQ